MFPFDDVIMKFDSMIVTLKGTGPRLWNAKATFILEILIYLILFLTPLNIKGYQNLQIPEII